MRRLIPVLILLAAIQASAEAPPMAYGYLYPDGSLPRAEWSTVPLPEKTGAEVVPIAAEAPPAGMMAMPPDMPTTYDPATHYAIPWQVEIDRRAADEASAARDISGVCTTLPTDLADLNAIRRNTGLSVPTRREADILYRMLRRIARGICRSVPTEQ